MCRWVALEWPVRRRRQRQRKPGKQNRITGSSSVAKAVLGHEIRLISNGAGIRAAPALEAWSESSPKRELCNIDLATIFEHLIS